MNYNEHIPVPVVGDAPSKTAGPAGGATGELGSTEFAASRQGRFEERLHRCRALGQRIKSLSKALSSSHHKKRHLIQVDALVNVPGGVAHVAELQAAVRRQLALNGEVPLIVSARLPRWILHLGIGNEGYVGAGHEGIAGNNWGCDARRNRRQRYRIAVGADTASRVRIGAATKGTRAGSSS